EQFVGRLSGLPVELPSDSGAEGAYRGEVLEAEAGSVAEIAQADAAPVGPDVAAVEEERAAQRSEDREAVVEVEERQAVAAQLQELAGRRIAAQRLVQDPQVLEAEGAVRGVAAGEEALVDEHVAAREGGQRVVRHGRQVAEGLDAAQPEARGEHRVVLEVHVLGLLEEELEELGVGEEGREGVLRL